MGTQGNVVQPEAYSPDEVCTILGGISRSTLAELERNGFLVRLDLPMRHVRYAKADVIRVLRRRREAVPDAHGLRMTEIPEGQGTARTPGESFAELDREVELIRRQAEILPPNGQVQDATE